MMTDHTVAKQRKPKRKKKTVRKPKVAQAAPPIEMAPGIGLTSLMLRDLTFDEIKELLDTEAAIICHGHSPRISTNGKLVDVQERLRIAKETPGKVCNMCGDIGLVVATETIEHGIKRTLRCQNRKCGYRFQMYSDTRKTS